MQPPPPLPPGQTAVWRVGTVSEMRLLMLCHILTNLLNITQMQLQKAWHSTPFIAVHYKESAKIMVGLTLPTKCYVIWKAGWLHLTINTSFGWHIAFWQKLCGLKSMPSHKYSHPSNTASRNTASCIHSLCFMILTRQALGSFEYPWVARPLHPSSGHTTHPQGTPPILNSLNFFIHGFLEHSALQEWNSCVREEVTVWHSDKGYVVWTASPHTQLYFMTLAHHQHNFF